MSKIKLNLISLSDAKQLNAQLKGNGIPANGRILIVSPKITDETRTQSGLFVPSDADKDTVPRKGVVIQMPPELSEEQQRDIHGLQVGSIVTYGLYAGKEIDVLDIPGQTLTILSTTEILYIETNK